MDQSGKPKCNLPKRKFMKINCENPNYKIRMSGFIKKVSNVNIRLIKAVICAIYKNDAKEGSNITA